MTRIRLRVWTSNCPLIRNVVSVPTFLPFSMSATSLAVSGSWAPAAFDWSWAGQAFLWRSPSWWVLRFAFVVTDPKKYCLHQRHSKLSGGPFFYTKGYMANLLIHPMLPMIYLENHSHHQVSSQDLQKTPWHCQSHHFYLVSLILTSIFYYPHQSLEPDQWHPWSLLQQLLQIVCLSQPCEFFVFVIFWALESQKRVRIVIQLQNCCC